MADEPDDMAVRAEDTPAGPGSPHRVIAFAHFFKNYMGISSIVAAALPIPVTSLGLIPVRYGMSKTLSVYTSLFCFLTLGMIFFSRHSLSRYMFPRKPLLVGGGAIASLFTRPMFYALACVLCVFLYHSRVGWAFQEGPSNTRGNALAETIDALLYIGIFVFAEASFILMAIKEYLQDVLKLPDKDLIVWHMRD